MPAPTTVRLATGFALGVAVVQCLPELPAAWALVAPAALLAASLWRGWPLKGALALGLIWAYGYGAARLAEHLPPATARQAAIIEGVILDIPSPQERGVRFDFAVERRLDPGTPDGWPRRLRLSWYDAPATAPQAGERWRFRVKLRPPRGLANPGGFDYERWLFEQGIRAVGYVRKSADNRRLDDGGGRWLSPRAWRGAIHERIAASLAGSPVLGLVEALALGVDDAITQPQWRVLRRTGTLHLIAVSGSHIGGIAGLVFLVTQRLCARSGLVRWPPPSVAAVAGMASALLYSALAGFPIPTQRALIMVAIAMGAVLARRHPNPVHILALALLAVLLYDPMAVLAAGFWLSFGAVALIAYGVSGRIAAPRRLWATMLTINLYTALGLAPLLLLCFGQISLVSPLANLLAVPVLGTVLVPLCLLGAGLSLVFPLAGTAVLKLAATVLALFWPVLDWLSGIPWAQWSRAEPPPWTLLPALLGAVWLLVPRGLPARWLGLVLWLPALTARIERPAPGEFLLTLLDVGQGLAAVVETRHKTLVFDTGPRLGPEFDMGAAVVEPYLRWRGIDTVDALVVSHGDNDHIGGAHSVLALLRVRAAYSSVPERLPEFPAIPCRAGQSWSWDGVEFAMLGPVAPSPKDNDNSCVLRVGGAHGSVLLTGDIERAAETLLVERHGAALGSDILVAPHHGSKTSSSPGFLAAVRPRRVLIPAGYLNPFGHPHPTVLARYSGLGAEISNTAATGAILFWTGGEPRLANQRRAHRHYWNEP